MSYCSGADDGIYIPKVAGQSTSKRWFTGEGVGGGETGCREGCRDLLGPEEVGSKAVREA